MSIYVSCPWSFPDGLEKVIKYLSNYEIDLSYELEEEPTKNYFY